MQAITADAHEAKRICVTLLGQETEARPGVKSSAAELVAQQALDPVILQQQWTSEQTRQALREALAGSRPRTFRLVRGRAEESWCKIVLALESPYVAGDKLLVRAMVGSRNGSMISVYLFELGAGQARLIAMGGEEIITL